MLSDMFPVVCLRMSVLFLIFVFVVAGRQREHGRTCVRTSENTSFKNTSGGRCPFQCLEHVPGCLFDNARMFVSFLIFAYMFGRAAQGSNQNHEKHNFQLSKNRAMYFSMFSIPNTSKRTQQHRINKESTKLKGDALREARQESLKLELARASRI